MDSRDLIVDGKYVLKKPNLEIIIQYKYNMWTIHSGNIYYFDFTERIYPKIIALNSEIRLSDYEIRDHLEHHIEIKNIQDLYEW